MLYCKKRQQQEIFLCHFAREQATMSVFLSHIARSGNDDNIIMLYCERSNDIYTFDDARSDSNCIFLHCIWRKQAMQSLNHCKMQGRNNQIFFMLLIAMMIATCIFLWSYRKTNCTQPVCLLRGRVAISLSAHEETLKPNAYVI
jgi:hypothetical protein